MNSSKSGSAQLGQLQAVAVSLGTALPGVTEKQLLQGPFSDTMTHAGQLAMLGRLTGSPVPPENFLEAAIDASNVGPVQPAPVSPDREWPEGPKPTRSD
jgi:hypothetical protein